MATATTLRAMTARYPGTCSTCAEPIKPGDDIEHAGRGLTYHAGPCAADRDVTATPAPKRPAARRYRSRYVSAYRGRCEDAPCCGCCG